MNNNISGFSFGQMNDEEFGFNTWINDEEFDFNTWINDATLKHKEMKKKKKKYQIHQEVEQPIKSIKCLKSLIIIYAESLIK